MVRPLQLTSGQSRGAALRYGKMGTALHLLIIDDQPETTVGLAGLLTDRGHRVEVIGDPLQALARLQQVQRDIFHLALVDVNMPGLDGPGLVREMRLRGDQTPVALITGYQTVAARLRHELSGLRVLGLVLKPIPPAELDRLLDAAQRVLRITTQDRRTTDFPSGSGGHQTIGSGGHQTIGSGGHRTLGNGGDVPFYGTGRTIRPADVGAPPSEGILARVPRPASEHGVIPDEIVGGSGVRRSVTPEPSAPGLSGKRPGVRTPLPDLPQPAEPTTGVRRRSEANLFYGPDGALQEPVAVPPAGDGRRPASGSFVPPDLRAPGTTSRFRRSLTGPPEPPPAPNGGLSTTSRIRRGLTDAPPPPPAPTPTYVVACARCDGQFSVLIRPDAYTVVCIHCGQLNRIDPL